MATNKTIHDNCTYIASFEDDIHAEYIPNYILPPLQAQLFDFLSSGHVPFTRVKYNKFGKTRSTPRFTWCYGQYDNNATASYRGKTFVTEPLPQWLIDLKTPIEKYRGVDFNAVILNKYENGEDHIGWHQDDEFFLDHHVIASITIGAERDFQLRKNKDGKIHEIRLLNGSLIIFTDSLHSLPRRKVPAGSVRYNITFRKVKSNQGVGNYYYYNRST